MVFGARMAQSDHQKIIIISDRVQLLESGLTGVYRPAGIETFTEILWPML